MRALRVIGGGRGFSLPGVVIDYVPWREETEAIELARCHVGVMPLSDGPWERGKCGYKLIQYMAAGRATVASPVGAASVDRRARADRIACEQCRGMDRRTHTALPPIASAPKNFGIAGRQRVEAMYSLQVNAPKLIALFEQALTRNLASEERLLNTTAI